MHRKKRHLNKLGWTIMEMVVVTIILGVITSLAIPQYTKVMERMRAEEGKQILVALLNAQNQFSLDNDGDFEAAVGGVGDLDISITPENFLAPNVFGHAIGGNSPAIYAGGTTTARANIRRNDNGTPTYVLSISDQGVISCWPGAGNEWVNLCNAIVR